MTVLDEITGTGAPWPPNSHRNRIDTQLDYSRLYRNRRDEILQRWSADLLRFVARQDELVPYPSAKLAARTLAAFLFGEDPTISHTDPAVRESLDTMGRATNLPARLLEGSVTQAVEGEIYLRPAWDVDVSPAHAIPTIVPGSRVIPRFRFGILVDAAVVTGWHEPSGDTYWRLLEEHQRGLITNRLYRGSADRLGTRVDLATHPQTENLGDEVATGIDDLLMVHVPLARDAASPHGVSLFDGLESLILAMHRLYSQEQHDAEMARRRIALPESFVSRNASGGPAWDRRTDLFPLSDEAEGPVGTRGGVGIVPIEFSDDLVARDRIRGRLEDFLIACGISPQTIMPDNGGTAISGTSRKLAQATTIRTVAATARYWADATSRFLGLMLDVQRVHLDPSTPDYGDELPSVALSDGLIDDPLEMAKILGELDTAEAISTIEKVRALRPSWTEDQVADEVALILTRSPDAPPPPQVGTFG